MAEPDRLVRGLFDGLDGRAWDNLTGERLTDFVPRMTSRLGSGVWAIEQRQQRPTVGGWGLRVGPLDRRAGTWTGAFVRFSPSDAVAPATPSGFEGSESLAQAWSRCHGTPSRIRAVSSTRSCAAIDRSRSPRPRA